MDTIRLKARAKINLGLDVVRRRPDGYHEVRMVMQMLQLYDQITLSKVDTTGIQIRTNLPYLPTDERNIAYKAAMLLTERFGIRQGIRIDIDKHIPVAAGMAGGSTDCAAVLYGMNRLFRLGLKPEEMRTLGVKLGADVPYCLLRCTALSEGIGEVLTPVAPLPDCPILVAKPPVSVSTKHVYEHLKLSGDTIHPDIDGMVAALHRQDMAGVIKRLGNVLETVTIPEYPVIARIKEQMLTSGAAGALMSGSGPTVFGLFDDEKRAGKALRELKDSGLARQIYLTRPFNPRNREQAEK